MNERVNAPVQRKNECACRWQGKERKRETAGESWRCQKMEGPKEEVRWKAQKKYFKGSGEVRR